MASSVHTDKRTARRFSKALLDWYGRNRRILPWRESPSPYATVVSEFMLQQTQVATVLPYFARWMERFPDFLALANAPQEDVLRLWEGLGYYSRARNLHALAREVVRRDPLPTTAAGWLEFPGVGPYTAAAIASIAFGDLSAVVDGNVIRILSRLQADPTPHKGGQQAARHFAPLALAFLHPDHPGDYNQAIMELGARICLPRNPACTACPVSAFCRAHALGNATGFPVLERRKTTTRTVRRLLVQDAAGRILFHRHAPDSTRLAGLLEFPDADTLPAGSFAVESKPVATLRRAISNERITEILLKASLEPAAHVPSGCTWLTRGQLAQATLSGPHRKLLKALAC